MTDKETKEVPQAALIAKPKTMLGKYFWIFVMAPVSIATFWTVTLAANGGVEWWVPVAVATVLMFLVPIALHPIASYVERSAEDGTDV